MFTSCVDVPRLISPSEEGGYALLHEFLARDPVQNLFLLGVLEDARLGRLGRLGEQRVHFYTLPGGGALGALTMITDHGLWVPVASNMVQARELGAGLRHLPLLTTIGERSAVDALWRGYSDGRAAVPPRMARVQRLLEITADDMGPWVTPQLRLAQEKDLVQVAEASAEMQLLDLGHDPRSADAGVHELRCLERIRAGRTYVIFDGSKLLFKADVCSRSRFGALVEGVFTAPNVRGQGVATRALGQICRTFLAALPRLTLHADPDNRAALGLYRKLGFGQRAEFRLLIPN